jgi:MFS family permease
MKPLHLHVALSTLHHLAFNGIRIIVTLYAAYLQTSPLVIGVIAGSFGMVSAFTAVHMGRWVDRSGPRVPMMLSSGVIAAGTVVAALSGNLWVLLLVCPAIGVFNATFQIATQLTIGQYGRASDRANNFALQSLGVSVAVLIGPLAAGLSIDHLDHSKAFLIMAGIAFIPLAVITAGWLHFPGRSVSKREGGNVPGGWRMLRDRPLRKPYIIATLNNAIWSVVSFMIPLYGVQIGLSATAIGALMACLSVGVVGIRMLMPLLTRRWKTWPMVIVAQAIIGVGFLAMPFTDVYALLVVCAMVTGVGLGLGGPLSTSLMYDASPPDKVGEVVGMRTTMANIAQTFVPLMSGGIGAAFGVGPVFWTVAAIVFADCWSNREKLAKPKP